MRILHMTGRLSGRWPDSQDFQGVRHFDEPQGLPNPCAKSATNGRTPILKEARRESVPSRKAVVA
jgi:hypothetical protein